MTAQPLQSSALKSRLGGGPILRIENFEEWDFARMGFKSDQDRVKWLDDNNKWKSYTDIIEELRKPREKFARRKIYEAHRKSLQEELRQKIKDELIVRSHEPYLAGIELPENQKIKSNEIPELWKRCETGWIENSFAETQLLGSLDGLIKELPFFDATSPWDFMVLGLPSLCMKTFKEVSYRQYRFAIEIIAQITSAMEDRYGHANHLAQHTIYLDHTHMTSYPGPGETDQDRFKNALFERTHHLDRKLDMEVAPPFENEPIMLSWLLKELGGADALVRLPQMMLIMFKPVNPIRQLIQHLLDQLQHEQLPCVIVCAPGDVDNVMPSGNSHLAELANRYSGDRSSDLVEDFLTRNYHKHALLTDETLAGLEHFSPEAKQEAKNILGTLCLFVRKDLRHSPPRANTA
ncbi:uncharacterized protein N0V89_010236 [Didymosphaeria variabile]|uniref:Uncharacterized protein n=1 Tax=Didymosphaeria variabile TaxID=1932322 RepID=A0A9W8XFC9_9PLEO|nr:uncharacterized protein N0V89_010236 [Didymosphaeria variabile]KAJ4348857.1 hypothetical protein N0V89_010236 [Didymosphaeria variabile]